MTPGILEQGKPAAIRFAGLKSYFSLLLFSGILAGRFGADSEPQPPAGPIATPTIIEKVRTMKALPGFFPLYWDDKAGRMWLQIQRFYSGFPYVEALPAVPVSD